MSENIEILIQNGNTVYAPVVEEGVSWETERKGVPGKLTFKVVKEGELSFFEGNPVRFSYGSTNVFYGFVFSKKRDKEKVINVTCYDQLRYLKNKDTYVYKNKTAGDLVEMIARDFLLNTGKIEYTGYTIGERVEDNKTLFDIIQNALDLTLQNTREMYVLYDDFGKICLKGLERLKLGLVIDAETGENYDYTSSIDNETYNKIKVIYDNKDTGKREIYITKDSNNINNWGVLQYFEKLNSNENAQAKADALLQLYNRKTRKLQIKNAIGDIRVRGGSSVIVQLDLGDLKVQNFMIVEKVKHNFKNGEHFMDLTLIGGDGFVS